jgi:hypothetical protein
VLCLHVLYKLEPGLNNLRIFAQGSLVVVLSIKLNLKHWLALNKGLSLVLADWVSVTLSQQGISYIFDSSEARRKSSLTEVKDMLHNHHLFCLK